LPLLVVGDPPKRPVEGFLVEIDGEPEAPARATGDELLDVGQAARMLALSPTTLYRRARKPPFAALLVETGTRRVLFSRQRIEEFLRRKP